MNCKRARKEFSFKNTVQKFCQKYGILLPSYKVTAKRGPNNSAVFQAQIEINRIWYVGSDEVSKKRAEETAARFAADQLLILDSEKHQEGKSLKEELEALRIEREALVKGFKETEEKLTNAYDEKKKLLEENIHLQEQVDIYIQLIEEAEEN